VNSTLTFRVPHAAILLAFVAAVLGTHAQPLSAPTVLLKRTNPLSPDSDGDGMPDKWEVDHGMNPWVNDAAQVGSTGVSGLQLYQYEQDPTHTNRFDLRNPFFAPDTSIYEALNNNQHTNRFYYDRNDRLIGAEYSRGVSIAYQYDGNGNIVRQTVLSRASETNGLPVLWRHLNGLTNNTSAYVDSDGDGWTDWQEWKAGTDPRDATSTPSLLSNPGTNIASLTLRFTPSNFVVGVGQLDGLGAEEIVLGADGNPGTNVNFLLVLTQTAMGWSTQRVDVGAFGITSITVGQPTNRPSPGIYLGLRSSDGSGRVMEFTSSGGAWQSNLVALSGNEAAFVGGVRQSGEVLAELATNGLTGALWAVGFTNAEWGVPWLVSSNASHRGIAAHGSVFSWTFRDSALRLLDAGGIEGIAGDLEVRKDGIILPSDAILNPATGKWHFNTPRPMTWDEAQSFFTNYHGSLVTINSPEENNWLVSNLGSAWVNSGGWIGLYWAGGQDPRWITGERVDYMNVDRQHGWDLWGRQPAPWPPLTKLDPGVTEFFGSNTWHVLSSAWGTCRGIGQVEPPVPVFTNRWLIEEPVGPSNIVWRGLRLAAARPRSGVTNQASIIYCAVDDRNGSGWIDAPDRFVFAEYQVSNNTALTATVAKSPLGPTALAQSFDLAAVDFLNSGVDYVFTAEPGGGVYYWSANDSSTPLRRQVFSEDYLGNAWHALAGVKMRAGGEGLAGLVVDPASPGTCSVILWPPQAVLSSPESAVFETAPSVVVLPSDTALGNLASVAVRMWDAEGNASTPSLQYQGIGATSWQDARLVSLDGVSYAPSVRVDALPSGSDHALVWNVASDLGANPTTRLLLRARAQDFMLVGDWSSPTPFDVKLTASEDSDHNDLPDDWEIKYFSHIGVDPNADPDGDAMTNMQEFRAGTDPVDANSRLVLNIRVEGENIRLNWQPNPLAPRILESADSLYAPSWTPVETGGPPYTRAATNGAKYYRLRLAP
jgi:YD repeat-containing protein